jgi:cysteine-rich repeat protein
MFQFKRGDIAFFALVVLLTTPLFVGAQTIQISTTTVTVSICGDAYVTQDEACDDGTASNTGQYSITIADRECNADCLSFGPYCGDSIVQSLYNEECDDGNNTDGDFCDSVCQAESFPITSGGGGGGFAGGSFIPAPTASVSISGKAYPNSDVNILLDGDVVGVVQADAGANFFFSSSDVTPGTVTFGFWAEDANQLRSISYNTTFQIAQNAVTNINNVLLPPTIQLLSSRSLDAGDPLQLGGQSVPEVDLETVVNSEHEIISDTVTDVDGFWNMEVDTTPLEEDIHTAKAQFFTVLDGSEVSSGFSQALTFFIGDVEEGFVGSSDLNSDGFVNLIDFSILLFHWGTDGGSSDPPADINLSGVVDLTDFSIMIFNWTG